MGDVDALNEPDFGPGAGWHRDGTGYRIPGCTLDLDERRQRAFRCFVLPIRRSGERLDANRLQQLPVATGGLLMMPSWDRSAWDAHLLDWPDMNTSLLRLSYARLVRRLEDARQYVGLELDPRDTRAPPWPQTWVCARTRERLDEIVRRLRARES